MMCFPGIGCDPHLSPAAFSCDKKKSMPSHAPGDLIAHHPFQPVVIALNGLLIKNGGDRKGEVL